ncbi:MAG: hypothetical protein ACLPWD_04835 [Methanobacterium sp.]
MKGRGLSDIFSSINNFLKKGKYISRAFEAFPAAQNFSWSGIPIGKAAYMGAKYFGYGSHGKRVSHLMNKR